MTNFKGTKGKWEVSKAYKTVVDKKGFGIAQEHGIRNSNEWKANALLISKAPEMLEMLERISKIVEDFGEWDEENKKIKQLIKEATDI